MRRFFILAGMLAVTLSARAVRPFITDDARTVGLRLAQMETWLRNDHESFQHWLAFAYGPTRWLELTAGGVYGVDRDAAPGDDRFSYALPLIQAKAVLREYKPNQLPGIAVAAGTFIPGGHGAFKPAPGLFSYFAITQCFGAGEQLLIHGNLSAAYMDDADAEGKQTNATWGIGAQLRCIGGLHALAEVFSGDPYVPGSGMAWQGGFRYFFSDFVQIDATAGQGIAGDNILPFWGSVGLRLVTTHFKKKDQRRKGAGPGNREERFLTVSL